ncbi:MAG: right-handed parallel beta-helix repeat-containing protein [Solirubrobacterales bacterium]
MRAIGINIRTAAAISAFAVFALSLFLCGLATASTGCDRVASPSGSNDNAGTLESPWQDAQYLVDHLSPGQTGCLRSGTFDFGGIDISQSDIVLTSYPGERATLRGTMKIQGGAEQVTVRDLDLDGRGSTSIGPFVFGDNAIFDNVDVTNHNTEICFVIGDAGSPDGAVANTVIENSRIHDCGKLPAQNGDHGIYVDNAVGTIIRDNWIYDNADRGIQLYPDSQGARIYGNVIDGNGEGVIISDFSSGNVVSDNVISNSKIRWNVEASNLQGTGNVVRDNCVWATNTAQGGYYSMNGGVMPPSEGGEFSASNNVTANPQFVDSASRNLNLRSASPCLAPSQPSITLEPNTKQIQVNTPVALRGSVSSGEGKQVTIQILRNGRWSKFGRARVKPNGRFSLRKRIGNRLASPRIRLRAKMSRDTSSRSVAIRVRD